MSLVSIVLPVYNGEKYLSKSIDSILAQTYKNFELIIVNDCSTDGTSKIISSYQIRDKRIKVITNEFNKKLPESLNVGFSIAQGDYYTWTSDDNIYKPNAIEWMVNYLKNTPYDMVSCLFDYIDENGKYKLTANEIYKDRRQTFFLLKLNNIGACFLYSANIAKLVGEYDSNYFLAEDYDYWLRIASYGNIAYVNENLYLYRIHSNSLTSTKKNIRQVSEKVILKNLSKFGKKNGLTRSQIFLIKLKYWWKYFKKKNLMLKKTNNYKLYSVIGIRFKIKRVLNSDLIH